MLDFIPSPILSVIAHALAIGLLGVYLVRQFFEPDKADLIGKRGAASQYERRILGLAGALSLLIGAILGYHVISLLKDDEIRVFLACGLCLLGGGYLLAMAVFRTRHPPQAQQPGLRLISKDQDGNAVVTPFERRKKDR